MFIGIAVPRTGTYAVQGEDELKGYQLAVEHINAGHELIKKISPKTKKGVLGKEVKFGVADSAAKPNEAVQAQQRFITENKAVLITGWHVERRSRSRSTSWRSARRCCSSAASPARTTPPARTACATASARTSTARRRRRRSARCSSRQFGKNKKAAFMTPDYTYGHTVTKSMQDYLTKNAGWTTVTNQVSPLGAPDFSSYLLNVANSGADMLINVNWGHDAVLSIQQAKQFGVLRQDEAGGAVSGAVPGARRRRRPDAGVYAATDFWWTLEDKYPLAKMFVDAFEKKYGYKPEWGAENAYMSVSCIWARMVEEAGSFYPPDVIKPYEKGETIPVAGRRGVLSARKTTSSSGR